MSPIPSCVQPKSEFNFEDQTARASCASSHLDQPFSDLNLRDITKEKIESWILNTSLFWVVNAQDTQMVPKQLKVLLEELAEGKDLSPKVVLYAKAHLGLMLLSGLGGEKDELRARELLHPVMCSAAPNEDDVLRMPLFECLAIIGNPDDKVNLATLLRKDRHKKDPVRARKLLEEAAKDSSFAMVFLAEMILNGEGGKRDEKQALNLLEEAYRMRERTANIPLAKMLVTGQGGPKDYERAKFLIEQLRDDRPISMMLVSRLLKELELLDQLEQLEQLRPRPTCRNEG